MAYRNLLVHLDDSEICEGRVAAAITLAEALLEKLGGDSLDEIRPRFESLRQARLDDLPMDNIPWQFGFEGE